VDNRQQRNAAVAAVLFAAAGICCALAAIAGSSHDDWSRYVGLITGCIFIFCGGVMLGRSRVRQSPT
jgi:hypothetical protein